MSNKKIKSREFTSWCIKCWASVVVVIMLIISSCTPKAADKISVNEVFERVSEHDFNPLSDNQGYTLDRILMKSGITNLEDDDWRVRLLVSYF